MSNKIETDLLAGKREQAVALTAVSEAPKEMTKLPEQFIRVTAPKYSVIAPLSRGAEIKRSQTNDDEFGVVAHVKERSIASLAAFGEISIPTGVTAVTGLAESGKTYLLRYLYDIAKLRSSKDKAFSARWISALEPRYGKAEIEMVIADSPNEAWSQICVSLANQDKLIVIDSLSFAAFSAWPGYSIIEKGFNPGFLFWLTALNNAASDLGVSVVVSFNPTSVRPETLEALAEALKGRVAGTIMTQLQPGRGIVLTQSIRRPDGKRDPLTTMLNFGATNTLPLKKSELPAPVVARSSVGLPVFSGLPSAR